MIPSKMTFFTTLKFYIIVFNKYTFSLRLDNTFVKLKGWFHFFSKSFWKSFCLDPSLFISADPGVHFTFYLFFFSKQDPIGKTLVLLEGDRSICRLKECNLGNFLVDAIVKQQGQTPSEDQWATIVLGLWNGGGIRSGNIDKKFYGNKLIKKLFLIMYLCCIIFII